jgi:hypothetical protein
VTVDLVIRGGTAMTPRERPEGTITPLEGTKVTGLLVGTIVHGRVVMRDGELVDEPGCGKPVLPAPTTVAA